MDAILFNYSALRGRLTHLDRSMARVMDYFSEQHNRGHLSGPFVSSSSAPLPDEVHPPLTAQNGARIRERLKVADTVTERK